MLGFLLGVFSSLAYSFSGIYNKALSKKFPSIVASLYTSFVLTLFSVILLVGSRSWFDLTWVNSIGLFIFGIISGLGLICLIKSFSLNTVGETLVITSSYPLLVAILSAIYFNNPLSLGQFLVLALVFIGVSLIVFDKFKFRKSMAYPFVTVVAWSLYSLVSDYLYSQGLNVFSITFIVEIFTFVGIFIVALIFALKDLISMKFRIPKDAWGAGVTQFFGAFLFIYSVSFLHPAIASSLATLAVVFASIIEYFRFKERLALKKIIGILVVTVGIIAFNFV